MFFPFLHVLLVLLIAVVSQGQADLILELLLDETTGSIAADSSGLNNDAVIGGTVTDAASLTAPGRGPNSASFYLADRDTTVMSIVGDGTTRPSAYSVAIWFKTEAACFKSWLLRGTASWDEAVVLYGWDTCRFYVGHGPLNAYRIDEGDQPQTVFVGEWQHLAVTFDTADGNKLRLYVNGAQVAAENIGVAQLLDGLWPQTSRTGAGDRVSRMGG